MKKIILLLILTSFILHKKDVGPIYYVSKSGNDATGDGSFGNPWKTVYKAVNTVVTAGDEISIDTGTYIETARLNLVPGVNLVGQGNSTHVELTYYDSTMSDAALYLNSATEGTAGNQTISNIWFDGVSDACYLGVLIKCRNNVIVHDCKFTGFSHGAVFFNGKLEAADLPPTTYATGNQFYNDSVIDCMRGHVDTEPGWGSVAFAGQKNTVIYGNYLANNGRPTGQNGDIFGMVEGWNGDFNVYNNTFVKTFISEGNSNNIMIESWYDVGDMHVYNNTFLGGGVAIDIALGGANKGSLGYSWYIDSNLFTMPVQYATFPTEPYSGTAMGVQFETQNPNAGYAIVKNNHFHKLGVAIQFATHTNEVDRNIQIHNNLADSIGYTDGSGTGIVNFLITDVSTTSVDSIAIDNNTFIGWNAKAGIYFNLTSSGTNNVDTLFLRNNFIDGVTGNGSSYYGYITYFGTQNLNHFFNQYNFAYGNTRTNTIYQSSFTGSVTNYTSTTPSTANPLFDNTFHLNTGSPGIGAGTNVGFGTDIGAYPYSSPSTNTNVIYLKNKTVVL